MKGMGNLLIPIYQKPSFYEININIGRKRGERNA